MQAEPARGDGHDERIYPEAGDADERERRELGELSRNEDTIREDPEDRRGVVDEQCERVPDARREHGPPPAPLDERRENRHVERERRRARESVANELRGPAGRPRLPRAYQR